MMVRVMIYCTFLLSFFIHVSFLLMVVVSNMRLNLLHPSLKCMFIDVVTFSLLLISSSWFSSLFKKKTEKVLEILSKCLTLKTNNCVFLCLEYVCRRDTAWGFSINEGILYPEFKSLLSLPLFSLERMLLGVKILVWICRKEREERQEVGDTISRQTFLIFISFPIPSFLRIFSLLSSREREESSSFGTNLLRGIKASKESCHKTCRQNWTVVINE